MAFFDFLKKPEQAVGKAGGATLHFLEKPVVGAARTVQNVARYGPGVVEHTTAPLFADSVRKTADIGANALQQIPRFVDTTARSLAQPFANTDLTRPGATGGLDKVLFGSQPIQTFSKQNEGTQKTLEGSRFRGVAPVISPLLTAAAGALNATGVGGAEKFVGKDLIDQLAKSTSETEIRNLAAKAGVKLTDAATAAIKSTKDPYMVKNILSAKTDIVKPVHLNVPPPPKPQAGQDIVSATLPKPEVSPTASATISTTPQPTSIPKLYTPQIEKTLQAVKTTNPATSQAKGVFDEVKNWFTPGGGAEGKGIANDLRAATGNLALQKNTETLAAKPDINLFNKMSSGDHANFIQKVEAGVPQSTPELQAAADKFRTAQETDYKIGQSLKPDIVHVENYFPRAGFWDNSKGQVDAFLSKWQQPTLGGNPAALQHRSIPTIYDGIAAGLKPKETNPAIIALNSRTQLLRAKTAQDFIEQQVGAGHDPALVQDYVNRVLDSGLSQSPAFKTAKDATYAVNNLQLGFSGFHVASTGLNAVVSQFANGLQDIVHGNVIKGAADIAKAPIAPLDYLFKGNKIVKDYKAGNITQDIKNIAEGGGRIGAQVEYKTSGLAKSLGQLRSGQAGQITKGVAAAPFRAFSTAAKPVMEYWVPRLKAGATKALIDRKVAELGANASPEAIRAAKSAAIDSIDNRFGQLVKDNLLWNKTLKDGGSLLMRSPGWNIGTVREIGGGITDLATKTARGKGLSERSAYTGALAATTMMIGTALSYLFTGKPPQDAIDYFYPKTGKIDKNGDAERVALPTYAKDIFAFSHNPSQTIKNKSNPLISTTEQVAGNKDYFGNMVRNPQDSVANQAKQTAGYVGKSLLPFSITNANKRVEKTASTKAQTFFGLTPAPGYITKSSFEQKVQGALNQALGSKPLTPEEQQLVNTKSQAKQAYSGGDASKINQLIQQGQITRRQADNLKTSAKQTSVANQFAYLLKVNRPAAADLFSQAKPEDLQKLGDINKLKRTLQTTIYLGTANKATIDASKRLLTYIKKVSNPKGGQ